MLTQWDDDFDHYPGDNGLLWFDSLDLHYRVELTGRTDSTDAVLSIYDKDQNFEAVFNGPFILRDTPKDGLSDRDTDRLMDFCEAFADERGEAVYH